MIPRNEYPRPQLVRSDWLNLNGEWEFEIDNAKSGEAREFFKRNSLEGTINVPFCPESKLSGVEHKDFMNCVWYRKEFEIPSNWKDKKILLHFGAVDYHAVVYLNGEKIGEHYGGYTPFVFDITNNVKDGVNYVTLCVYDDVRSGNQPAGKQSERYNSYGCLYTRTTGIWQTVWLECVGNCYVNSINFISDIDAPSVYVKCGLSGDFDGCTIKAEALWEGKKVGGAKCGVSANFAELCIALSEKHLWDVGKGNLYDLRLTIEKDGQIIDDIKSYFGLRTVCLKGRAFMINGRSVFGRWVLDQGYYPDGIYTAPTDEALKNDIIYSMQLGFNGARLHEKVFEPRYLYWADKLGYLCWGEYPDWGLNRSKVSSIENVLPEWIESVNRDMSHPSIIGWCPFNETWGITENNQNLIRMAYRATKAIDPTRPVIDTSGGIHVETDIYDFHDYEQDVEIFTENYAKMTEGYVGDAVCKYLKKEHIAKYDGVSPAFVSEYGGAKLSDEKDSWGYGTDDLNEEQFIQRYKELTESLLNNPNMMGFCYTQLYDVEQEVNGLMTYDRKFKISPDQIHKINSQPAAIEKSV